MVTRIACCLLGLAALTAPIRGDVSPPAPVLTDRQVYHRGLDSLVGVYVFRKTGMAFGSGAVVGYTKGEEQVVLTAAHLFSGKPGERALVRSSVDAPPDAVQPITRGTLLIIDREVDLAVIVLEERLPRAALSIGQAPAQADPVYYFGNADEAPTTFGRGILTRVYYPNKDRLYQQYTGLAWPGMSGGPILDEHGQLVGVVAAVNRVEDPDDSDRTVLVPEIGYMVGQPAIARILSKAGVR
jgi:serine protease Do